jgi:hypothetical protein
MPLHDPTAPKKAYSWALLAVWLTLIFLTSCTVVPFDVFVRLVQGLIGVERAQTWFAWFWGVAWLLVVKGWHFCEYAAIVLLANRALEGRFRWAVHTRLTVILLGATVFAISDEWHQTFVPERGGTIRDVLVDVSGALAAAFVLIHFERRRRRTLRTSGETIPRSRPG